MGYTRYAKKGLEWDELQAEDLFEALADEILRSGLAGDGRGGTATLEDLRQAILQALRNGAKEFLTAPVQLEELLTALKRLTRVSSPAHNGDGSSSGSWAKNGKQETIVTAVLGSRGGVGCTTIAVNVGATVAKEPGSSVALIDLDLALGDCDVALDLMGDYTLADVALNIDRDARRIWRAATMSASS